MESSLEVYTGPLEFENGCLAQTICDVRIFSPPIPKDLKTIANYGLSIKEQVWRRIEQPIGFYKFTNDKKKEFVDKLWDYRTNGYWIYIGGRLQWLTGTYFFTLQSWTMDTGEPPVFRDCDRRRNWFVWNSEIDDSSFGIIELGFRRNGKSTFSGAWMFDGATTKKNASCGVQSKTNKDSKDYFTKRIVQPWRKLPEYWRPSYSNNSNPKSSLDFFKPALRGKGKEKELAEDLLEELGSVIDYRSSEEVAYDGARLHRYVSDEGGKTTEANVDKRWKVVKQCLVDATQGGKIIGKAWHTSTAEELEKGGGANYLIMWKGSCYSERDGRGRTKTGLYRYFCPGTDGYVIDEFGYSDVDKAKELLMAERKGLRGEDLNDLVRKYPFTVSEAFRAASVSGVFNMELLQDRYETLISMAKPLWVRGNLEWKDGKKDGEVVWKPNREGKWQITYHPDIKNHVQRNSSGFPVSPLNNVVYRAGIDPIDHGAIADTGRGSKPVCYVKRLYDPVIDANKLVSEYATNRYVLRYSKRVPPLEFYDDMIKTCVYFGCKCLPETNKIGCKNEFIRRGYAKFILDRPESTITANTGKTDISGLASSPLVINAYVEQIKIYMEEDVYGSGEGHGHTCIIDFIELIEDLLQFDMGNTQKFDDTVAFGYTELASNNLVRAPKREETKMAITSFFSPYDNSGSVSKAI